MRDLSHQPARVNSDQFSMVPRADIPRSTFTTQHTLKTTFDGGYLIPVLVEEVLPGDHFRGEMTVFARMQTLLFPLMDHVTLESFFFFCPNRLVWDNWVKMMGERTNPNASISYEVPYVSLGGIEITGDNVVGSNFDYMGLPIGYTRPTNAIFINALPFRALNLIWNEWFRDQNLQNSMTVPTGDGPDLDALYIWPGSVTMEPYRRNKKHDYFTSALPWALKGDVTDIGGVQYLGISAPVRGIGILDGTNYTANVGSIRETDRYPNLTAYAGASSPAIAANNIFIETTPRDTTEAWPVIWADLSSMAANTVNALRLAVQTQRLLERDARSGTRYTELLRAHFGVRPEDSRLQRPEYIGGGKTSLQTQAIPQTAPENEASTPLGSLGGQATFAGQHRFRYAATEHGFIIGLIHVDADLSYFQGLHRKWTRRTRYDYYWPVFAHLGEQPVLTREIRCTGVQADDEAVFGYQERWAEYRHRYSHITGFFRNDVLLNLDPWHSAQSLGPGVNLGASFIESNPPFSRNIAAGISAPRATFLADMLFNISNTRAMPMRSVPGMMDHF